MRQPHYLILPQILRQHSPSFILFCLLMKTIDPHRIPFKLKPLNVYHTFNSLLKIYLLTYLRKFRSVTSAWFMWDGTQIWSVMFFYFFIKMWFGTCLQLYFYDKWFLTNCEAKNTCFTVIFFVSYVFINVSLCASDVPVTFCMLQECVQWSNKAFCHMNDIHNIALI